jgi:hypothetical protein
MNWLILFFALECGLLPNTNAAMYQPDPRVAVEDLGFYALLEATVEAYGFYVGGEMRCFFWKEQRRLSFWPERMQYGFKAGWRCEHVEFGFRHYCVHPVLPYLALTGAPKQEWELAYEEFFVRVSGKIGGRR